MMIDFIIFKSKKGKKGTSTMVPQDYKAEISVLPSGCGTVHYCGRVHMTVHSCGRVHMTVHYYGRVRMTVHSCGRVHMVDREGQVTVQGVGGSPIP